MKQHIICDGVSMDLDEADKVIISVWDSKARKVLVWECEVAPRGNNSVQIQTINNGYMTVGFKPTQLTIKETQHGTADGSAPPQP
jgi:hypothetical protein